ncbi:uncharacterized protein TNIN_488791 [Trichonephila inaurata madagascariensis]|uniref:Uncharacterized protein n=1 Tax=Trichonephila inaurata madagascariensis TaxID=2747483 RepID=A0A8X7BTN2_9ARAC|nr:uncharacterized protein TNIN_488791 [Trichonephila inaurata madagascariensis]
MEKDAILQHLLRHLFPRYYVDHRKINMKVDLDSIEPFILKGALTVNLFNTITKSIHSLEDFALDFWMKYLHQCKLSIQSIPNFSMYITHIMMLCLDNLDANDMYEKFINICATVIVSGIHAYRASGRTFYKLTPQILTVFFENVLKKDFKKQGGWESLEEYLVSYYLDYDETDFVFQPCRGDDDLLELREKTITFFSDKTDFSPFPNLMSLQYTDNLLATYLTAEVLYTIEPALLAELSSYSLDTWASTSDPDEESNSNLLPNFGVETNPIFECGQSSEASGDDGGDTRELSYHTSLESHILNLNRLVREFSSNTENSNSDESLDSAAIRLATGLRCLKLKLEHAISLLESLEIE